MPNMNGYGGHAVHAAKLDREDAGCVPIIRDVGNAFAEDVSASLASGMNAHLSKPHRHAPCYYLIQKIAMRKRYEG